MVRIGSHVALVPICFLAIYLFIVMLVPWARRAWHTYGYINVIAPAALAILGDWLFFNTSLQWFGWFNYLFILGRGTSARLGMAGGSFGRCAQFFGAGHFRRHSIGLFNCIRPLPLKFSGSAKSGNQ
jgi:hypothetical protein